MSQAQFSDVAFDGLYGDAIMEHFRHPRCRSPLPVADWQAHEFNPFCGDEVTLQVQLDGAGRVAAVCSQSQGCSIIQASASMLATVMAGKSAAELAALSQRFRELMRGETLAPADLAQLQDLAALQVVRQYPVRVKCALLPWTALEEGLAKMGRSGGG